MVEVINVCGGKRCCPQILKYTKNNYKIIDEAAGWKTGTMTKKQMLDLKKAIEKNIQ